MRSRLIMWSIERRLVTRVNQHSLKFTRRVFGNRYPDSEYTSLLTEIIETAIADMLYQRCKHGDHADMQNDEILTAVREIGMSIIDLRGFGVVKSMIELIYAEYNLPMQVVEDRYFKLLDDMFDHFTSPSFVDLVLSSVMRGMPDMILEGIRDDVCLISYDITEPHIRMRFLY